MDNTEEMLFTGSKEDDHQYKSTYSIPSLVLNQVCGKDKEILVQLLKVRWLHVK